MKRLLRFVYNFIVSLVSPKRQCIRWIYAYCKSKNRFVKSLLYCKLARRYGCYVGHSLKVGKNLELRHPTGIVLGAYAIIGDNVTIFQQVTIGGRGNVAGHLLSDMPVVEDDVTIFAGAKIIGKVRIGKGCVIGANAVVTKDTEPYGIYAGVPARKIGEVKNNQAINSPDCLDDIL